MNMFNKYPQTFDHAFSIINQNIMTINNHIIYERKDKISFILDNMTMEQKEEAVSLILEEEEHDPKLEFYLPTLRSMIQDLKDPFKYINHLKYNFIENIWQEYKMTFKEIFTEAFFLFSNKCPLPHKEDKICENDNSYGSLTDYDNRFYDFILDGV